MKTWPLLGMIVVIATITGVLCALVVARLTLPPADPADFQLHLYVFDDALPATWERLQTNKGAPLDGHLYIKRIPHDDQGGLWDRLRPDQIGLCREYFRCGVVVYSEGVKK